MKKATAILSLLLALVLFVACGEKPHEKAPVSQPPDQSDPPQDNPPQDNPPQDNPSQDNPPQQPDPFASWRDDIPDSPYDIVTLVREMNFVGYVSNGMQTHNDTLTFTLYKKSACDELYYISNLTDENVQNIQFTNSKTKVKAIFRKEATGESCEKTFYLSGFKKDGRRHLAIEGEDKKLIPLTENAVWYFLNFCNVNHFSEQDLLLNEYITDTNMHMPNAPVLLKDTDKKLTPEEAANTLIKKFFENYKYDQPDCPYVITEIGDTTVKLYDAEKAKNDNFLNNLDLRENQWVLYSYPNIKLEGPTQPDGSGIYWCMEFEAGWWRLWMKEIFYNQNKLPAYDTNAEDVKSFDKVQLSNYLIVAGYNAEGVSFPAKNLEFTFDDTSVVTKFYKILQKIDTEQGIVEDQSHYFLEGVLNPYYHYKAKFTVNGIDTVIDFTYSPYVDGIRRVGAVAVKQPNGNGYWLTDDAAKEFVELCNANGMTDENFLINHSNAVTSMFDWSWSMGDREPLVLEDTTKQYTPEQAAEKLMNELAKELCEPAPNRFFHYENYQGWDLSVVSSQSEEYKNNDYYKTMNLTADQYIIEWGSIKADYIGIGNDGGPSSFFVLSYENGQWKLYPRERAS